MNKTIFILLSLLNISFLTAQEESWENYMTNLEKGPASISVRMDLSNNAPDASYKYILMTGFFYDEISDDGLPGQANFDEIYTLTDSLDIRLNRRASSKYVGSLNYNFQRIQYYYLSDYEGINEELKSFYKEFFPKKEPYIEIKEDPNWSYYLEFLYPKERAIDNMNDLNMIKLLESAGDKLTSPREVKHRIAFFSDSEKQAFLSEMKTEGFNEKLDPNAATDYFPIVLVKDHAVDANTLRGITAKLRSVAKKHNGQYESWETFVVN